MDTLTKSCSRTIVITANGEVQTHEEAAVYVKELDVFFTMKVLEDTPAVLSLGKLCDENGHSYEWINGQKPHLIKNGIRIQCNTENFVPIVVPGLSTSSSSSSSTSLRYSRARAKIFGDLKTADHKVLSEGCESRNNHRYAVVVQDLATQWIQSYTCKTKTSQETQKSPTKFLEPTRKPIVIYTDNSLEFGKACEKITWNHRTSTPPRSQTNGIAARVVRRVKEGTSAVLLQLGLDNEWYCFLRNIEDLLTDGKTQCERRFGIPFNGTVIAFGAMVEYHPISVKDLSRLHQFGKKVLLGIFLGHVFMARNLEGTHHDCGH